MRAYQEQHTEPQRRLPLRNRAAKIVAIFLAFVAPTLIAFAMQHSDNTRPGDNSDWRSGDNAPDSDMTTQQMFKNEKSSFPISRSSVSA